MFVSYLGGQLYCKSGLWVRFPFEDINYLISHFLAVVMKLIAALSSATQHGMPLEFGGKWEILRYAGYSVKLK